jgi:nitrogen regulatory protein P-II 1
MPKLVYLVIQDPSKVDEVICAWVDAGVSGLTVLDSSGWTRRSYNQGARDDLPLFPSIRMILRGREFRNRTIFSVVPDTFDLDALIAATEMIIGDLIGPGTGILFVLPLERVVGLQPPKER